MPQLSQLRSSLGSVVRETPIEGAARRVRNTLEDAISLLRGPSLRGTRKGAGILMYHGVTPEIVDPMVEVAHIPAMLFRQQVRHLKRHYHVASLEEVVDLIERGKDVPNDWAVLTFDDGYRNNLTCAREILKEEGDLPMSLFLPTELIGTRTTLVTTLIVMALGHGKLPTVRVPRPGGSWESRALHDRRARANAYWEMLPVIKALASPEQQAVAEEFFSQFGVGEIAEIRSRFPSCDWLSWDEVREMQGSGVDIGGHTRTHVSLSEGLSVARVRDEVPRADREGEGHGTGPFCVPKRPGE